jgi:hypothetical protein
MTINNYKTITITNSLTSNTFSTPIFLQFVPTACIIKYVTHSWTTTTNNTDYIAIISSSLVNNLPIYHLVRTGAIDTEVKQQSLDLKFQLNTGFINSNYDFTITNIAGGEPSNFGTMQLAITIEFIQEI